MYPLLMAAGALANIGVGLYGMKGRRAERRAAETEFQQAKAQYQNLDTTNQFANLQNPYEDLTVNLQAADFTAQQQNQGLSNVMSNMSAAAGGSGITALAQALAQQQSQNMQAASASIGQQESTNAAYAARGDENIQTQERTGAETARGIQRQQAVGELELGIGRRNSIIAEQDAHTNMMLGGLGQLGSVGLGGVQNAVSAMENGASPVAQWLFGTGGNILTGRSGF